MLRSRLLTRRLLNRKTCSGASPSIRRFFATGVNENNAAPKNPYNNRGNSTPSAMDMVNSIPPIVIDGRTASCDGGNGALGHPRVFINTDPTTLDRPQPCPYCGLRFVSKASVIDAVKGGRKVKQGSDFILPADVESYVNGEKHQ